MPFSDARRRILAGQASDSRQYLADQNRANMARAIEPSIQAMRDSRVVTRTEIVHTPNGDRTDTVSCSPQAPMRAVIRSYYNQFRAPDLEPARDHEPVRTAPEPAEPASGSPVNCSGSEFLRLPADQQALVQRQALRFAGAADRIRSAGLPTLREAFFAELDHQSSLCRRLDRALHDGRATRFSKSAAKRDRSKGAHKPRDGGTANFRAVPAYQVGFETEEHFPARPGWVSVERLRRGDAGLLAKNARGEK